ncbi:MAG: dihydropteroate synthase, partial [Nitrospira sp.]|nr:dihydropteroate synthase [Nitrospira sp.]
MISTQFLFGEDRELVTQIRQQAQIEALLKERILILDGAMGTMIQQRKLDEAAFRGERFKDWKKDLKGHNDLLNITQPAIIEDIHRQYLEAGADIVETNTFNSQSISLADYHMASLGYELSRAGAECARRAVEKVHAAQPGRQCFVAGAIGPTTKTSSISTDVNNPAARGTIYEELVTAYGEQVRGLLDGGADLLLVETIFDTLNAKAAFFAIQQAFASGARPVPVMASVTFIQAGSNRGVTGQTVEAFWNSISHVPLLSVGMNCALGPKEMRPLIEELSRIAPIYLSAHPNAGLPNPLLPTGFPETPDSLAPQLREWAQSGWLNIVGGCCGTTPDHIKSIAEVVRDIRPRTIPAVTPYTRLSGLEAVTIRPDSNFVNIGERTNVTGSPAFAKLILAGDYESALSVARQQVEGGAQIIDINMDEGMLDSNKAMEKFLRLVASEPDICKVPIMVDSSRWEVLETGLRNIQGKAVVNSISLKEGEQKFVEQATLVRRY